MLLATAIDYSTKEKGELILKKQKKLYITDFASFNILLQTEGLYQMSG